MKISKISIHNFRSIIDAKIESYDFLVLAGANNAGKSNIINAIRCFYEDLKWSEDDFPKAGVKDYDSWVKLTFTLTENEWKNLADKYKKSVTDQRIIILKRYFKGDKAKAKQSNIYAIINGEEETDLFYGAKNISTAKCGSIIYIPALTTPNEQLKTTGPSPLREMFNFMLNNSVSKSVAYTQLVEAFKALNTEATQTDGFLANIAEPINSALRQWDVKIDFSLNPVSPEEISKSLIKYAFIDTILEGAAFDIDRFGHGFQRSVIYEMIRIAASFKDDKEATKKEFNPDFTLLLFEEPEAFLHPSQQENMAYHLRRLGEDYEKQVLVTSHSPVFVSKSNDDLGQICRIQKYDGVSYLFQLEKSKKEDLIQDGGDLLKELKAFVDDPDIACSQKKQAQKFIQDAPSEEIARQHEKFRFQLWLDSERASMFFADKVLLVEGATEKALFNYLLANKWHDLTAERVLVVDAFGKYNFHRFLNLFEAYGIYHGVMFDNDDEKNEHAVINQFIRKKKNKFTLADPFEFKKDLETHLGLSLPKRPDLKPLEILKALEDQTITEEKLSGLRKDFCQSLALEETK